MAGARDDLDQWRGGPGLRRVNLIHQRKTPSAAVELGRGGSRVSIEGWRFAERQGNPNTEPTGDKQRMRITPPDREVAAPVLRPRTSYSRCKRDRRTSAPDHDIWRAWLQVLEWGASAAKAVLGQSCP